MLPYEPIYFVGKKAALNYKIKNPIYNIINKLRILNLINRLIIPQKTIKKILTTEKKIKLKTQKYARSLPSDNKNNLKTTK